MRRHEVTDKMWDQIKPLLAKRGRSHDNRLFVNAVLFHAKTGLPWRDLPERFGKWYSIYQRNNRWNKLGIWKQIFELTADPEPMVIVVDSTSVRANQVAAGQKKRSPASRSGSFTWWTDLQDSPGRKRGRLHLQNYRGAWRAERF